MAVEHQDVRGGRLPTCSNCSQYWSVYDQQRNGRGHERATLVCGLFLHTAVGGQGGPWEEMGVAPEGGSGGQSLPLVHTFWCKTGMDLMVASIKLCWEPTHRALYCQRESDPTAHVITYLDELAVCIPSLDAWDQLVWLTKVAIPCALIEAKLYGYCQDQAVDLGPVIPPA